MHQIKIFCLTQRDSPSSHHEDNCEILQIKVNTWLISAAQKKTITIVRILHDHTRVRPVITIHYIDEKMAEDKKSPV